MSTRRPWGTLSLTVRCRGRRVQCMHTLRIRSALLLSLLLVVLVACGAPAPVATPTPTLAPTPTPAPALTATPTLTPTPTLEPTPTARPSPDGRTAMLQQRADQVRTDIIRATKEGCAFSYEEGEYRNSGFSAVEGSDALDVPYGRVARTTQEFDSDGQPVGMRQSVTGLQSTLSSSSSGAPDFPTWLSDQVVSLVDMQARGTYAGESSLIGQPSLRYETRTEGGVSSSAPTEIPVHLRLRHR